MMAKVSKAACDDQYAAARKIAAANATLNNSASNQLVRAIFILNCRSRGVVALSMLIFVPRTPAKIPRIGAKRMPNNPSAVAALAVALPVAAVAPMIAALDDVA